jgi:hypothetical protein
VEWTLLDPRHSRRIAGGAGGLQRGASAEAGCHRHVGLARVDLPQDGPMGFGHHDYSSALRVNPKSASSLYGRGLAKLKKGDTSGGNADIAAAKAIEANIVATSCATACGKGAANLILSSGIVLRSICGTCLRAQQSSRQWTPTTSLRSRGFLSTVSQPRLRVRSHEVRSVT